MLAVPLPEADVVPLLGGELSLAAVNRPALCVVAGPTPAVEALRERLAARGIDGRRLHTSHAFHSRDDGADPGAVRRAGAQGQPGAAAPAVPVERHRHLDPPRGGDRPGLLGAHIRGTRALRRRRRRAARASPTASCWRSARATRWPPWRGSTRRRTPAHAVLAVAAPSAARPRTTSVSCSTPSAGSGSPAPRSTGAASTPTSGGGGCRCRPTPSSASATGSSRARPRRRAKDRGRRQRDLAAWFYAPGWKRYRAGALRPPAETAGALAGLPRRSRSGSGGRRAPGSPGAGGDRRAGRGRLRPHGGARLHRRAGNGAGYDAAARGARRARDPAGHVLHLWNVTAERPARPARGSTRALERGFYSLVFLAQALGKRNLTEPVRDL